METVKNSRMFFFFNFFVYTVLEFSLEVMYRIKFKAA